jgi:hypothetical protein
MEIALIQSAVPSAIDRGFEVGRYGLSISRPLTLDEWRDCGVALTHGANRMSWAIGDWLIYGAGRGDYGEYYMEARQITGRSCESLSQHARVSRAFRAELRAVDVPWSFYREALRLPESERGRTLILAAQNHWTRDGLAAFISTRDGAEPSVSKKISETRRFVRPGAKAGATGWKPPSHHTVMRCPSCGHEFEPKRGIRRRYAYQA